MSYRLLLTLAGLILLLSGCAPRAPEPEPLPLVEAPEAPERVEDAAARIQAAPEPDQGALAVNWAGDYLAEGRLPDARRLLSLVAPRRLEGNLRLEWVLTSARIRLAEQDTRGALRLLESEVLEIPSLTEQAPADLRNRLRLLRVDALALAGELRKSLIERVELNPELDEAQQRYNEQTTWTLLMRAPRATLQELSETRDGELLGWVKLARLYRDPITDIDSQAAHLEQWQRDWEGHPAERRQPTMIEALREAMRERPENIAVLLPLTGPLAPAGEAIRDGLLTAYYSALEQGHPVPGITFYNTTGVEIIEPYNEALRDGADFVIGPLDRSQGEVLAAIDELPIPTLGLNYVDQQSVAEKFYQFGLSPEDEARQIAAQARAEGAQLAGILHPRSEWGRRVAQAFERHWEEHEGIITTRASYGENYGSAVSELLGIGRSQARARQLGRHVGELEFEPRRRRDLDFLFLLADASQARQIKPALNFHYAGDLQVFATSHIYAGRPDPSRDSDLDGIRFVDIPWLLERDSELHESAEQAWPRGHGRYARLFALGIDAYRLQMRLSLLHSIPDSAMPGATGQLRLEEQNRLVRELDWAWFSRGEPQRMPAVAPVESNKRPGSDVVVEQ